MTIAADARTEIDVAEPIQRRRWLVSQGEVRRLLRPKGGWPDWQWEVNDDLGLPAYVVETMQPGHVWLWLKEPEH